MEVIECNDSSSGDQGNFDFINNQSLTYIWGYVAFKFIQKYPHLGNRTIANKDIDSMPEEYQWLHIVSNGYLMSPSEELAAAGKIVEKHFLQFHGQKIELSREILIFTKNLEIGLNIIENLENLIYFLMLI